MTDVEEQHTIIEPNDKCKKKKSDKLGVEVLKRNAEGAAPPKKRAIRSHSTAPHFPASSVAPKPRREKPHHSDDDEEEEGGLDDINNNGEDGGGGEEETSTMGTSSSSVTLSVDDDDDDDDEEEEDHEDEKEGRCYTFDATSSSCELSFVDDEEDGDADEDLERTVDDDEEDDDDDTTTEGTETAYDVEDNDDEGDDNGVDLPQTERVAKASTFESINAVTGVVGTHFPPPPLQLPIFHDSIHHRSRLSSSRVVETTDVSVTSQQAHGSVSCYTFILHYLYI
jgi:hypothetical protein